MIELRAHQKLAIEKAKARNHLALFHAAGTGKTATMINILRNEYNASGKILNTLIFSPLSVCAQWKTEFAKFSKIPESQILVLTGPGPKRVETLKSMDKPCIVVTNYEASGIKPFYEALARWNPEIAVLDESHRVKDSQSKRAKLIYPLISSCRRRFLMTGTPTLNSLLDIFGQFKAMDPSIFGGGYWAFKNKYFYNKNAGRQFSFPEWVPHAHSAKEIGHIMGEHSVQAKLEECVEMPPLQVIPVSVEISGKQLEAYNQMKKHFVTEVNGMISSSEFEMVKTLRMRQILAGFVQPDERDKPEWFSEQPRLDALMDIIGSIGAEKCIIWTTFVATYKKIGDLLEKAGYKYAFLTGEQSITEKNESVKAFTTGDCQILISNPSAGGTGLNLQEARYAIYFLRNYNLGEFIQSTARNYRSGSEKLHPSVLHYQLYTKGTVDEVIAAALLKKQDVAEAVLAWAKKDEKVDLDLASLMSYDPCKE